ncbi:hypothetical protein G6F24_015068 [Rhizopus arrhizus]|nr:hypothetical protein G6F24_015068 [Rhizopus arrhizus]
MAQEGFRQCRRISVLHEGLQVEAVHRLQIGAAGLVAVHHAEGDALAGDLGALLADVLAVLVVHRAEELVECRPVTRVMPLELHVFAQQPVVAEQCLVASAVKVDVGRRYVQRGQCLAQRQQQRGAA